MRGKCRIYSTIDIDVANELIVQNRNRVYGREDGGKGRVGDVKSGRGREDS